MEFFFFLNNFAFELENLSRLYDLLLYPVYCDFAEPYRNIQ